MKNKRAGFTLIELLVVIAIIALLLAILMPALNRAKELAKRVVCGSQLKNIGIAVSGYAGKADGDMPNVLNANGDEEYHPYVAFRGDKPEHFLPGESPYGKMIPYRLGCLWDSKLIDIAKTFYCPSNKMEAREYRSYIRPSTPNTSEVWGTLPQQYNVDSGSNQWVRAGYEWFPVDKDPKISELTYRGQPILETVSRKYDKVTPHLAYCADLFRQRDLMSHKYGKTLGMNLLYIDGRVIFCSDMTIFRRGMWDKDPGGLDHDQIYSIYYERVLALGSQ